MINRKSPFLLLVASVLLLGTFPLMGLASINNANNNSNCYFDKAAIVPDFWSNANLPPREAQLTPELRRILANYLGWHPDPAIDNLCGGYYQEPLLSYATPVAVANEATRITADEASLYASGKSTLRGHVMVEQAGKQLKANTAYIYRDAKTSKVTAIDLQGRAEMREAGRLVIAEQGHFNALNNSGDMENVLYRVALSKPQITEGQLLHLFGVNGWGRAAKVVRESNGNYQLERATYATCPPQNPSWQIEAKHLSLDKASGRGVARDVVFRVKDIPIFYTPYYSFPIDDRRKSGFLTPVVGYSDNSGAHFAAPYYWNIAPNYDATITPMVYSLRGAKLDGEFRYLTENSIGQFSGSIVPDDQEFGQFITDNEAMFPQLVGESTTRWNIFATDTTHFDEHWSADGIYQAVSDDYYLQDFSNSLQNMTSNQLLRQGQVTFADDHWLGISRIQNYLTLHPVNQTATDDVYSRYPQLIFDGHYEDVLPGFDLILNNEYNNFVWPDDGQAMPQGSRFNFNPILTHPVRTVWGYLTPSLQLQEIYYDLSQNVNDQAPGVNYAQSINVTVPQASVDSGIYFERNTRLFGNDYVQTLEPRLYYLYVPNVNQTQVPVFDSSYYIFTYDQLFRANRFTGGDRVGDANQLSYALSSRWLDDTGVEKMRFSVGEIYYFTDRKVQLMQEIPGQPYADSPIDTIGYVSPTADFSPIAAQAAYALNAAWSIIGDIAWDPDVQQTNNADLNLHYQPGFNEIVNLSYAFLTNADTAGITDTSNQSTNFHQITVSYSWPLTSHWSSLGAWGYNVSHGYAMEYLLGMQYESCCWGVRVLGGKVYKNLSDNNLPVYSDSIYLQVLLKGLGTVASSQPAQLISSNIAGYEDIFK